MQCEYIHTYSYSPILNPEFRTEVLVGSSDINWHSDEHVVSDCLALGLQTWASSATKSLHTLLHDITRTSAWHTRPERRPSGEAGYHKLVAQCRDFAAAKEEDLRSIIRTHLFYALSVVSRIITNRYINRQVWRTPVRQVALDKREVAKAHENQHLDRRSCPGFPLPNSLYKVESTNIDPSVQSIVARKSYLTFLQRSWPDNCGNIVRKISSLSQARDGDREAIWLFITVGCSGRGVQWMGVVLCNKTIYNVV